MKHWILFLLAAAALHAQPEHLALHIDLTGDWRISEQDDPRFSDPAFDDSGWSTIPVPLSRERTSGAQPGFWLRRAVTLPPGLDTDRRLAMTIGSVPYPYDLYLNGTALHRGDIGKLGVLRPRTFEFALPRDRRVVLAIRVSPKPARAVAWLGVDQGPWVITSADTAPRQEAGHALAVQKLSRISDLVQALIVLALAVVVLLVWISQRDQRLLLWLGLYMVAVAAGRINLFSQIGPDPLIAPGLSVWLLLGLLPGALFAQVVSVWTGARWMIWPTWVITGIGCLLGLTVGFTSFRPLWALAILVLIALARHVWLERHEAGLAAAAVLILYAHTSSWGSINLLGLPGLLQYDIGGWISFAVVWHLFFTTIFGFAVTLVLVRRLLRDREEKILMARELEAARTVQQLLLPSSSVPGVDAVYWPSREVGGDFYQVLDREDGSLLVLAGDVSGKGLKAAMLVSLLIGILRNEKASSPAQVLEALNRGLQGHTGSGFVTCCCARFPAAGGAVRIASAGHLSPYVDGREAQVEAGLPLGIAMQNEYAESTVEGERFTFVSDGVVEAANASGELFGFERTRQISGKFAQEIAAAARAWGQNDDITVVTVERRKQA